jgi:uncharacterized protein (UPF0179 family)
VLEHVEDVLVEAAVSREEHLAVEGEEFTYLGSNNECRSCQLKTVCFNLKPTRQYRITKLRDKQHECNVHEGIVYVVEVEELPLTVAVTSQPIEGTTTTLEKKECKNIGCNSFETCNNAVLQNEKKYWDYFFCLWRFLLIVLYFSNKSQVCFGVKMFFG